MKGPCVTRALSDLTNDLLLAAKKAGADNADALAVDGTSVSIDVLNGKLEHAERSEGVDIGLRVILGKKQACVSSSDTRAETISQMAERAVAMAREAPDDPNIALAMAGEYAETWDAAILEMADPADEPAPTELESDACLAEAAALEVKDVSQVQAASAGYERHQIHLATSNGFSGGYGRTSRSIGCVAITGSGTDMERDYFGDSRVFQGDLDDPREVGQKAGQRAVGRAGSRQPKTGSFPVLFDERVAASLIGHLLSAVNGSMIVRGSSWARDLLDQQVLPTGLSITEEPHRPRVGGSRPFDAEGMATGERKIVDDGVLKGWTLDLSTARNLGLTTTANASRGTSAPPRPSTGNIRLSAGTASQSDLISDMGTGLLVTGMIGSSINPTTGDYSRGASGFWIENGEITYPINECTIAGNLIDMLKSITPANDAREHLSRVVPSLLVQGLTLAGK